MSYLGFNPTPLHNLIVFVLSKLDREAGAVELAKVLYLVDVESEKLFGSTLTGEEYTRQDRGPLPWHFHSAIRQMEGSEVNRRIERRFFYSKHCHTIGNDLRFDVALTPQDKFVALRVIKRVKPMSPQEIEKSAYNTEPMLNIQAEEIKTGTKHIGERIDFSLVEKDSRLARWRKNKAAYEANPIPEYEAIFEKEMVEHEEFLAS